MATHLFEITMPRDEVQVGWNGDDREAALESLAKTLVTDAPVLLWQYAVTRGASGPEVAPLRRIAFFPRHVLRVAPTRAEHRVVDLPE